MPTFGERLKVLREKAGLSQAELAERAGISQRAISHWELGKREPLISAVQKLCAALGVSCDVFFAKDEDSSAEDPEPTKAKPKPTPKKKGKK